MRVAVRPPEYFPRATVLALALAADRLVLADTLPYSRQGFQNRCRVRTPEGGRWLTVPVGQGAVGRPLREVPLPEDERWRRTHRRTLEHALGSAPFYAYLRDDVEALLAAPAASLADLTSASTAWLVRALRATTEVVRASDLPGAPSGVPAILRAAGATAMLVLPETAAVDARHAAAAGVPLRVLPYTERPRRQNFPGFVPGCTGLDLLALYGPEAPAELRAGLVEPTGA